MMWRLVCVVVLALSHTTVFADDPEVRWTIPIESTDFDEVKSISRISSDVYFVGTTSGSFANDGTSNGGQNILLGKVSSEGDVLWIRQTGTVGSDRAYGIAANSTEIYAVGSTTGRFFGAGKSTPEENLDAFIGKFTPQGLPVWIRQFGTLGSDESRGVALDSSGVYVTGTIKGLAPGYASLTGSDGFARKYDFDGNLVWEDRFGTSGTDDAAAIVVNPSGVFVTGTTTGAFPQQDHMGENQDVFIRMYNTDGANVWTRQLGTIGDDTAAAIAASSSGVYVAGSTTGSFSDLGTFNTMRDMLLIKYDFDGNEIWIKQYGTEQPDAASGIAIKGSHLFVVGSTEGNFPNQTNSGQNLDTFLVIYNTLGRRQSTQQLGTPEIDQPFAVAANSDSLYVVGSSGKAVAGTSDGYVISLDISNLSDSEIEPLAPEPEEVTNPPSLPRITPEPDANLEPTVTPATNPTVTPLPTTTVVATADSTVASPPQTPTPQRVPRPTRVPIIHPELPSPENRSIPMWQFVLVGVIGVLLVLSLIDNFRKR